MSKSVMKIRNDEISMWVKNPNNIYAANTATYSNIFSNFSDNSQDIVTSAVLNNFTTLAGKTIGYTTDAQKPFADVLAKMGSAKCSQLIYHHLESINPSTSFETTSNRIWLATLIKHQLEDLSKLSVGDQCLNSPIILNKIDLGKKIGAGSFGNIYTAHVDKRHPIALKMAISGLTKAALNNPYDPKFDAWNEINILKPYINSLIEKGICQNFPYVYQSFICRNCDFEREVKGKITIKKNPCYIVAEEIAAGDLKRWATISRSREEKYNALFQCMAGLHTLQKYFQICNNDIKSENILFKDIPIIHNSYWEYVIMGTSYYIPNTGSLFFVNDFGVSYSFDPSLPICKVLIKNNSKLVHSVKDAGHRPFIIVNGKLTPVKYNYSPLNVFTLPLKIYSKSIEYTCPSIYLPHGHIDVLLTDEQRLVMKETDPNSYAFYADSNTLPFFASYIDTQDMIRTFVGGERVSQNGPHNNIAPELAAELDKYQLKDRKLPFRINIDAIKLTPSMLLAGYFIENYFKTDMKMFLKKPAGGLLLQKFVI